MQSAVPSHLDLSDPGGLRPAVAFTTCTVIHGLVGWWPARTSAPEARGVSCPAGLAVVCALLAIGSFQTLFAALDRLEALHASLVVFPIAVGTAVAGFAVWARWGLGEPLGRRRAVGLALVTAGVVILGLR